MNTLLASLVTAVVSIFISVIFTKNKRKADDINSLLGTVNSLLGHSAELTNKIMDLQSEVVTLRERVAQLTALLTAEQLTILDGLKKNDSLHHHNGVESKS